MSLDEQLAAKAVTEAARLAEAERQARIARADYHTVVRRLHLGGASLREIAQVLNVSHQRVQQIVEGAGGSWWQRVWRSRKIDRDAVCTFCERPPAEVAKLIAGPDVYICDACVDRARRGLTSDDDPLFRVAGTIARCSFCGKRKKSDRPVISTPTANVCEPCLLVCVQILEDRAV